MLFLHLFLFLADLHISDIHTATYCIILQISLIHMPTHTHVRTNTHRRTHRNGCPNLLLHTQLSVVKAQCLFPTCSCSPSTGRRGRPLSASHNNGTIIRFNLRRKLLNILLSEGDYRTGLISLSHLTHPLVRFIFHHYL